MTTYIYYVITSVYKQVTVHCFETSRLLLKLIFTMPWDLGTRGFIITKRMQIPGLTFLFFCFSIIDFCFLLFAYKRSYPQTAGGIWKVKDYLRSLESCFQKLIALCLLLLFLIGYIKTWCFPGGSVGKESICLQCRRPEFDP